MTPANEVEIGKWSDVKEWMRTVAMRLPHELPSGSALCLGDAMPQNEHVAHLAVGAAIEYIEFLEQRVASLEDSAGRLALVVRGLVNQVGEIDREAAQ